MLRELRSSCSCVAPVLLYELLLFVRRMGSIASWLEARSAYFLATVVVGFAVVSTTLLILRHYYYGSVLGEDTGYYNQIFWSTLHGGFFKGSITQARYFDPPVHTEFAVHNSPILFLIWPIYWLFPSFYTLLVLRNVALAISAIPLYLIAREKINGRVGVVIAITYYLCPNILQQSLNGFYPLHFAALFIPFAFYFFLKEQFGLFITFLLLSLSVEKKSL